MPLDSPYTRFAYSSKSAYLVDLLSPNKQATQEYATMSKHNVIELGERAEISDPLTELLKNGARQLIQQAVEAELQELLDVHKDRRLANGNAAVVRNGYLPAREIQTGLGPVTVRIPKVRAKSGQPVTFRSALVPPWYRPMFAKHAPWKRPSRGSTVSVQSDHLC